MARKFYMAEKKNIKVNSWELNRERFSSFVVDLREVSRQTEENLKKTSQETSQKITHDFYKQEQLLKKKIKKIIPNIFLAANQTIAKLSQESQKVSSQASQAVAQFSQEKQRLFSRKGKQVRQQLKSAQVNLKDNFFKKFIYSFSQPSLKKIIQEKQRSYNRQVKTKSLSKSPQDLNQTATQNSRSNSRPIRPLLMFVIILLLIITPLKILSYFEFLDITGLEAKLRERSQAAFSNLLAAGDSATQLDWQAADAHFQEAGRSFLEAQTELDKINNSLLALISFSSNPQLRLAAASKKFVAAGISASSLGSNLALATDSLFNSQTDTFSKKLNDFSYYGNLAVLDAKKLQTQLAEIDTANLPLAYQEKFTFLKSQAEQLSSNLASFIGLVDSFKEILGLSRDRRYLLVFQNNSELRASGGFLGSYALIDFREGQIRNLEVPGGGSYDTEAGLKLKVKAPQPLWLVNPLWHFWDANWWPDWPTTAQNLMWFYEKSAGPTVDGVISFTPTVVESLLKITGPIDLTTEYGLIIDENNFWETVQKVVESKNLVKTDPAALTDLPPAVLSPTSSSPVISNLPLKQGLENNSENKPKKIIGDLLVKILEILPSKLNRDNLLPIVSLLEENLAAKQVLFYFNDPDLQAAVSRRNWGGEIRTTSGDYLSVVNTNIAGQKSDRKILEKIDQSSLVQEDGSIINIVKIYRTHTGLKNEPLVGVRNVDWLRVYIPLGSQLLSASGFTAPDSQYLQDKPEADWLNLPTLRNEEQARVDETSGLKIYEENGKTVLANWVMVDPGETTLVTLQYRLPFNFYDNFSQDRHPGNWSKKLASFLNPEAAALFPYSLLIQKQPGAQPSEFSSQLILPAGLEVFWRYPADLTSESGWQISDRLVSDKYWSIIVEKK